MPVRRRFLCGFAVLLLTGASAAADDRLGAGLHLPRLVKTADAAAAGPCGAPAPGVTAQPQKVVVNVPPPEVIVRGGGDVQQPLCGWCRRRGGLCEHCGRKANAGQTQTIATIVTPAAIGSFGSLAMFNGGGLTVANMNPALALTAGSPVLMQQGWTANSAAGGEFAGLRAIHDAEVRAAALAANRARDEAELRSTLAAVERVKGSMSAALAATGGAAAAADQMTTAVNQVNTTLTNLGQKVALLEQHLIQLQKEVAGLQTLQKETILRFDKEGADLRKIQEEIIKQLPKRPEMAPVPPPDKPIVPK